MRDLEDARLDAEARYARERLELYRAKAYGGRKPTSPTRLRELEREAVRTATRLRRIRTVPERN